MFEKVAVPIKLRVTEDDGNTVALLLQKKEIIPNSLSAWGFFLYFRLVLIAQNTFQIDVVSVALYIGEESEFFNFALPLADTGALYFREITISTLTNNYQEFFSYITYCPIATLLNFFFVD